MLININMSTNFIYIKFTSCCHTMLSPNTQRASQKTLFSHFLSLPFLLLQDAFTLDVQSETIGMGTKPQSRRYALSSVAKSEIMWKDKGKYN